LGTTLKNQNSIQEEIKRRLISFGVQCFVFQVDITKININIHRTIILPVVFYGCERLREKHRLRVFEYRVLRGI
jgi:hypothetical protein